MIKNIFKLKNDLVVTLDNSTEYKTNQCTDEFYDKIVSLENDTNVDDKLKELFYPGEADKEKSYNTIKKSSILVIDNNSARIPSISNLTIPQMLAEKIANAEERNDVDALTAYKNFWTLLSLNPNAAVRDNLFWFLNKWGMSICKSGLFVAYRNVELKEEGAKYNQELTTYVSGKYYQFKNDKKDPKDYNVIISPIDEGYDVIPVSEHDDNSLNIGNLSTLYENIVFADNKAGTVYTDNHTRTMEIRLGHVVSIPRYQVDENSEHSCSSGSVMKIYFSYVN